jgi:S-formylglutathione hydrolase FrmB
VRERTRLRAVLVVAVALTAGLAGCTSSASHARMPATGRRAPAARRSTPPRGGTTSGVLRTVVIPGSTSGFRARPAMVYLPPSAGDGRRLPVLELLHGVPGSPADWVQHGHVAATMDAFAARHGGLAPIVVIPDINGSLRADSECVRSPRGGDVERYLTVDVPRWAVAHLPASPDRRDWAIGGLSEGGTCSIMLALRDYPAFRAFADLSGLARPTVGDRDNPPATIRQYFDGSRAAYDEHDPLWLLGHDRYPGLSGWLGCGAGDVAVRRDQRSVAAAARAAQVSVHDEVVPGRHSWQVWAGELQRLLPWLWGLIG